jgi:hypothetical protein
VSGLPVLYGVKKTFQAVSEDAPGSGLQDAFQTYWPRVREWYTTAAGPRPSAAEARAALASHMLELTGVYETICDDVRSRVSAERAVCGLHVAGPHLAAEL